jgi:hypothetical protein
VEQQGKTERVKAKKAEDSTTASATIPRIRSTASRPAIEGVDWKQNIKDATQYWLCGAPSDHAELPTEARRIVTEVQESGKYHARQEEHFVVRAIISMVKCLFQDSAEIVENIASIAIASTFIISYHARNHQKGWKKDAAKALSKMT